MLSGPIVLSNDRNQLFLLSIRDDDDVQLAVSLEQPEYQNFVSRAVSMLPIAGAARIAFVNFNLLFKPRLCFDDF